MTNTASNVTSIESKQPAPSAKFIIQATLDGFPIVIEGEGRADNLRALIDRLRAIGAVPPQAATTTALAEPTKKTIPTCSVHGSQMKESRKPGKFYCAKKAADGEYCRETA